MKGDESFILRRYDARQPFEMHPTKNRGRIIVKKFLYLHFPKSQKEKK
jgi:hypothetical protein